MARTKVTLTTAIGVMAVLRHLRRMSQVFTGDASQSQPFPLHFVIAGNCARPHACRKLGEIRHQVERAIGGFDE